MTRGLHHAAHEPRPAASVEPAPDSASASNGGPRPTLAAALPRMLLAEPAGESTFLSRRTRLLRIGVALEQRGPATYDAALRACEALIAGRPRTNSRRPPSPNQLELALGETTDAPTAPPAPAPFRTRPARRRWR